MPATSTLGARISEARELSNYSITEISNHMAVTQKTIKNWENGNSKPRANKLQMLSGVLNVPLLWLLDGDEQFDPVQSRPGRLEALEQKVERMNALQIELLKLSDEVITEIDEMRKIDQELNSLAA